jgi:tagatose-1,6-bisphosphate aldolase non-catalytic subunit AgaZ/GatZ
MNILGKDIRINACETGLPVTEYILKRIKELKREGHPNRTLLAVCPNSLSVIKAAFRAAKRNDAPIKFAATLNQVDFDGGYTGLTQSDFIRLLRKEAEAINYKGVTIVAIDHGGPWLKDIQTIENWSLDNAMNGVKHSFELAVSAGYDLIHVDPTIDITLSKSNQISIETVVERTIELIAHSERFRKSEDLPPISYEVGTEEVHGGLANDENFDQFLNRLKEGLAIEGLNDIWPCFIVGKVGTDLHTTLFDPAVACKLTSKVEPYGSLIKGHYSDDVSNPEDYPLSGMGAANVGPELTICEYVALIELEAIEIELFTHNRIALISRIKDKLWDAVLRTNRWKKWLLADESDLDFEQINPERQKWLIMTCCRYIWQSPEVVVSRYLLYENLKNNGIEAEEIVLSRIERNIDKYYNKFNLVGLNDYL